MRRSNIFMWATVVVAVLAGGLVAIAAEAANAPFWGLSDPALLAACRRWSTGERQAWGEYERQVIALNRQLQESLQPIQGKLAKAGKLQEALRVQRAVEDLKQGKWPNRETEADPARDQLLMRPLLARRLHQTRWRHADGWILTFDAGGMVVRASHHQHAGTWVVLAPDKVRFSISRSSASGQTVTIKKDGRTMTEAGGAVWTLQGK